MGSIAFRTSLALDGDKTDSPKRSAATRAFLMVIAKEPDAVNRELQPEEAAKQVAA